MAAEKRTRTKLPALDDRFKFFGDALSPGNQIALKPKVFEVEDRTTGAARGLKLWRKTGLAIDDDLRSLWRHEMRQIQRVMFYAGAREVLVDVLEFVEDSEFFGVLLERSGQPLSALTVKVKAQHWLRTLIMVRSRTLFWKNVRRLAAGLGIVHSQGLVHGKLSADVVMTEGAEEPDFQLGGFEWSLWLSADVAERSHAELGSEGAAQRSGTYSFAEDWRALGQMICDCLGVRLEISGDFRSTHDANLPIVINTSERVLLKRMIAPTRFDLVDSSSVIRSIDAIVASIAQRATLQSGTFILCIPPGSGLGEAVNEATDGEIAIDEYSQQLDWVRADLDTGAKLLVPRPFDPRTGTLRIITDAMIYRLKAHRDDGSAVWDIGSCVGLKPRGGSIRLSNDIDRVLEQPITVTRSAREATETRARLGPDVLDWSIFAGDGSEPDSSNHSDTIRQALLLVQVTEAVVKALECFPIEILETARHAGQRFITLRAEPDNDRDRFAKRVGMSDTATALKRLFEEDRRDADGTWRVSLSPSLGSTKSDDTTATFIDLKDYRGRHGYQFAIDDELPPNGPYFLKAERDTGTEKVISRRLRNIKALNTRIDLAEMLADPWRVRRSSREAISEADQKDAGFLDLDEPKRRALLGLWSTSPSYFVVGPPGVGKTKLATEAIRRRFMSDRTARLLVSAQGHDGLDHLQSKITEALSAAKLDDVIVVRTTTPDRRPTSDEEVHLVGLDYLEKLHGSEAFKTAPQGMRDRISALRSAAVSRKASKNANGRDERLGLHAISSLVLDAANIVISTANSPEIESMVELREQFDWVIIEEAAKATGPEIVGPLMLSGRRLLIGDHHQLPPFEARRLAKILSDFGLLTEALGLARPLIGFLLRDGELDELERVAQTPERLREVGNVAFRLVEPFRTFVEDDERRARENAGHRAISSILTEQRRMDPAIARIISNAFYKNKLKTQDQRAKDAESKPPPFRHLLSMPASPVVVVNFDHVSASGRGPPVEREKRRWHNPSEAEAVIDVLRQVRAREGGEKPTLAVLSPYQAQVELLEGRISTLRGRDLAHLDAFASAKAGGGLVGTVDSFQGSEADLVVISLVRNNPRSGGSALGFLSDPRRINVALSRTKSQLVLVGSLDFLSEAVRGVNPDDEPHDLSFLTRIVETISTLCTEYRGSDRLPLATIITPDALKVSI